MPSSTPFTTQHHRYDEWFVRHAAAYQSELLAMRALLPWWGSGLSIGVGTGRFAAPLGVSLGIDPSPQMLAYAASRGVGVVQGVAEALPFADKRFDYLLSVTTICFVDDITTMLTEAYRVLRPGGSLVIGFIDRSSELGKHYLEHQAENIFYREATFYSAKEVAQHLSAAGFSPASSVQTLSQPLTALSEIEPISSGYGRGAFVAMMARRPPATGTTWKAES